MPADGARSRVSAIIPAVPVIHGVSPVHEQK